MEVESRDIKECAIAMANRLRLVQFECTDESAELRQACLSAELEEATKRLTPEARRHFLQAVLAEFPLWQGQESVGGELAGQSTLPAGVVDLARQLAQKAGHMAPGERQQVIETLAQAGLADSSAMIPGEMLQDHMLRKLKLRPGDAVDLTRAMELLALLVGLATDLEQVGVATWRELSGGSGGGIRPGELTAAIMRCLSGDRNTPVTVVEQPLARVRRLVAGFINVIPLVGRFTAAQARKLEPKTIRQLVEQEGGGGIFGSVEKQCWQRYVSMAEGVNEQTLETHVRRSIVEELGKNLH